MPNIGNVAEKNSSQILDKAGVLYLSRRVWEENTKLGAARFLGGLRLGPAGAFPRSLKCRRAEGAAGLGDREADLKRERLKDTDIMSSESIEITGT